MAEQMFNEKATSRNPQAQAFSAGLAAQAGSPLNPHAAEALTNIGYNPTEHNSTLISTEAVEKADVILTFTKEQMKQLLEKFPSSNGKLFTLTEYANSGADASEDVLDPYGKSAEVYKETAETIDSLVDLIVSALKTT